MIPNFNLAWYSCCLTSACVPGLPARHSSLVLSTCGFWIISFSSYFLSLLNLWQPCCCFLPVWILTGPARGFAIVWRSVFYLLLFTLVSSFRNKLSDGKAKNLFALYAQYWKRLVLDFREKLNQRLLNSPYKCSLSALCYLAISSCTSSSWFPEAASSHLGIWLLRPTRRSSEQEGREGGSIRAGQAGALNNAQVASAPEGQHTETQNNELGQSAGRSSSPDCPLTSVATGWSGPYSPPERHFPAQGFWELREVKKNSITIQTIHNNRT